MNLVGRLRPNARAAQEDKATDPSAAEWPERQALIINAYSYRNFGDAAIMLGTALLLREARVRPVISSRYHEDDRTFYGPRGIEVLDAVLPLDPLGKKPSGLKRRLGASPGMVKLGFLGALVATGAPLRVRRRLARRWFPVLRTLKRDDYVVMAGGGYLYSGRRRINFSLVHAVAQVHLCRWAGMHVVSMPQSVGPVKGRLDRWLIRSMRSLPLVLREIRSSDGLALPRVCAPDVALMLGPADSERRSYDVTIVVMDWIWARAGRSAADLTRYVERVARTVDLLVDEGLTVALGGHSLLPEEHQDDFAVARRVADSARAQVPVLILSDVDEALRAYTKTRLVIGTRLHSVLLALACGVPALALGYQPKSAGCLDEIGWPHVKDVESFTPQEACRWVMESLADETRLQRQAEACCAEARQRLRAAYTEREWAATR